MKKILKITIIIFFVSFLTSFSYADIVELKNGDKIEGSVIKQDNKEVQIKTEYGIITITKENIASINFTNDSIEGNKWKRDVWYIGFSISGGYGELFGGPDYLYKSDDIPLTALLCFSVGGCITNQIMLGFDFSTYFLYSKRDENDLDSQTQQTINTDYITQQNIMNIFPTLTIYPIENNGFHFKVGAGASFVQVEDYKENEDKDEDDLKERDSEIGVGGQIGIGYDFWLGESFNLSLISTFTIQKYFEANSDYRDDSPYKDSRSITVGIGFMWY